MKNERMLYFIALLLYFNLVSATLISVMKIDGGVKMSKNITWKVFFDIFVIILGTAIFSFGLVFFNIPNKLAEGGIAGITLILKALFNYNPAITNLLLNVPIVLLGGKILGRQTLIYTIFGIFGVSFWLDFWQKIPIVIDLDHDLLIVALVAGIVMGFGSGIIYRVGGTTGGSDIVARILDKNFGIPLGRGLFGFDVVVLIASLTYVDLHRMIYTLIFSFVFSRVVEAVINGGYSEKGILVVSDKSNEITEYLMSNVMRGITYFKGEGAYSKAPKDIIYMVVGVRELPAIKRMIHEIDEKAFISIINVHEVIGEGFTYLRPKKTVIKKNK